jgi:hypothetical protein
MLLTDIANQRLHHQHLINGLSTADQVIRSLGAVQSQDFTGARWALGQRCISTTDDEIIRLYNEGVILRTHMLRPTWHFVLPEDIRWMQELTAPRVHAFNKYYYKSLRRDCTQKGNDVLRRRFDGWHAVDWKRACAILSAMLASGLEGLRFVFDHVR